MDGKQLYKMKTFEGDFNKFLNKLKNKEPFSLSRWGDGELSILEEKNLDLREKGNGEFRYDKDIEIYQQLRKKMMDSYTHKDDEYYVGVACPCCVGDEKYQHMKTLSGQDEDHLTWANIFVNSNYPKFVDEFIPELNNHKINLIVNEKSSLINIPFPVFPGLTVWYVGTDAWVTNYDLVEEISDHIFDNDINNEVFLIAAGPFANILTHKLWEVSTNNTYIDIGTVLDPYLGLKLTRGYLNGGATLNKTCVW